MPRVGDDLTLAGLFTERNCLLALAIVYVVIAICIGTVPYEPMEWDLADATTNAIWTDLYSQGKYDLPYDNWTYPITQSVVVEHDGQYVVVNEKGPGLAVMLVPFHIAGVEFLFAPLLVGLAVLSTYMLGMRLAGWKVGVMAAFIVLTNLSVMVMWHRYYWTDAATMHLLVLSVWLLVEAVYWSNGRSLDPRSEAEPTRNQVLLSYGLASLSGIAFSASVSTRYAVALVVVAMLLYVLLFHVLRAWPELRRRDVRGALRKAKGLSVLLFFVLGMLCLLLPLMQYNAEYFGGPLSSGYDATSLMHFDPSAGIEPRNTSTNWFESAGQGIANSLINVVALAPLIVFRMPALLLVPLGLWLFRKRVALALLLPWVLIAFHTYLSLSWVSMYQNPRVLLEVVWEPRYFMPALPAVAVLGAVGVESLATRLGRLGRSSSPDGGGKDHVGRSNRKKARSVLIALVVLGLIALPGIWPAYVHFSTGAFAESRPHDRPRAIPVTTDQLATEPERYEGQFVIVRDAVIIERIVDGWTIRSKGSTVPENIPVRLRDFPPAEFPEFQIGDEVEVMGPFVLGGPPGTPPEHFIGVKWGTQDYIRLSR